MLRNLNLHFFIPLFGQATHRSLEEEGQFAAGAEEPRYALLVSFVLKNYPDFLNDQLTRSIADRKTATKTEVTEEEYEIKK